MKTRFELMARERARLRARLRQFPAAPAMIPAMAARSSMVSGIDPTYPVYGTPTTFTVRNNFQAAKDEIEELQADKLDRAGGTMIGEIVFAPNQRIDGGRF